MIWIGARSGEVQVGGQDKDDAGFTLLEVVAALTVLAIGIVGVISVTNSSMNVAITTSARSKAVALATQKIEEFRTQRYESLEDAVDVSTEAAGGRTYTVETAVSTRSVVVNGVTGAYKEAWAIVSWTDQAPHEVRQQTIIYPGGLGPYVAPGSTPAVNTGPPSAPTALVATPGVLAGVVGIDLAWNPPATSDPPVAGYVVQYSTDSFTTTYEISTGNPTPYFRVVDVAANTTYMFRVLSVSAYAKRSASYAQSLPVTTSPDLLSPCRVGVVTVAPAAVHKAGGAQGNKLKGGNPTVAASTSGNCLTTTLRAVYSPNPTTTLQSTLLLSGGVYTGVLDGNQSWDVGRHEVRILDGTDAERGSAYLLVCESSAKVCG